MFRAKRLATYLKIKKIKKLKTQTYDIYSSLEPLDLDDNN